ncbi:hypothetical protein FRB98_001508, partial [Tulasnella sp. 332]
LLHHRISGRLRRPPRQFSHARAQNSLLLTGQARNTGAGPHSETVTPRRRPAHPRNRNVKGDEADDASEPTAV